MDQSTTPELPEYLIESMADAETYFNALGLLYNERSHDAFRAAVERFMEEKFECAVVDYSEYRMLETDAHDASVENDKLRDQVADLINALESKR